jgi:putative PIN family toxin of toxin-antitoxin system
LPTLRVVLDTNVLASGIVYRRSIPGRIVGAWNQGAIKVVLSAHILGELARILPRFDHKLHWQASDYANLIDILTLRAEIVEPEPLEPDAARDPGDVPVLGTLLASKADYLTTGDGDLLVLAERYPTIVAPAEFWRKHGS